MEFTKKKMTEEEALKFAFFLFMESHDHEEYTKEALDEQSRELSFQIIDACKLITQIMVAKELIDMEQVLAYARKIEGIGDMTCQ